MAEKKTVLDLSFAELAARIEGLGLPPYRAQQIWHAVYRELAADYGGITTLPNDLRRRLTGLLPFPEAGTIGAVETDGGETVKRLIRLGDGETIEAVEMIYPDRGTICVSSQVGCPIGCPFCATGKDGFIRDLSAGEIVAQVLIGTRNLKERGRRLTNVVYMGMGEPFLNYEATMKSIRILNDRDGFGLGARGFTVSTSGANLAVSLHAANDRLRDRLVPINRSYPLAELLRASRDYVDKTHRRITFELPCCAGSSATSI